MAGFFRAQINTGFGMRQAGRGLLSLLGFGMLLGLTACIQLPEVQAKKDKPVLVYPLPPDEARFIYERTISSNFDVDTSSIQENSSLRNILTGENAMAEGFEQLGKPYAVTVNRGRIFVSDTVARVVKVFDVPQGRYFTIGAEEPGKLAKPIGIDTDAAGNLYVADASAKVIMVYDRDGKFLRQLASQKVGEPPPFSRLVSVAVDKKGEKIYAVDIGGSRSAIETHRIRVYDAHSGAHLFDIGKRGEGDGEFNLLRDIAVGENGELYVVDGGNFRIQVLDAEGKFLRKFGKVGKQLGNFGRPKEIAVGPDGNLYIVDSMPGNFQIFNPQGELLMYIGGSSTLDGPARYSLLSGIAVDEDGRIYVIDQTFRKLEIFRPAALSEHDGYLGSKDKQAGQKPGQGAAEQSVPVKAAPVGNGVVPPAGKASGESPEQTILDDEGL